MLNVLVALLAAAGLATIVACSGALLARPLWVGIPSAGIAYGIISVGLASMGGFLLAWASPRAESILAMVLILACTAYLSAKRMWRHWRAAIRLVGLISGIGLLYVGLLYLWRYESQTFGLASQRFAESIAYPVDNVIPFLFSDRIATGSSTHMFLGDWNGSDRPPLLSGFILLLRPLTGPLGVTDDVGGFGASVVAQLLWIPALYAALRSLRVPRVVARLALVFAAVTGTTMLNSVYTWPKLISAAIVLSAIALLLDAIRRPRVFRWNIPAAILAAALGLLAHGAAAFAAPGLLILLLIAYRRQQRRSVLVTTAIAATISLAVYAPWAAYQHFVDPPGDRLLKWHLAGVVPVDPRPFFQALIDSYSTLSLDAWLASRWQNLTTVFDPHLLQGIGPLTWANIEDRRWGEFLNTSIALGFAAPIDVVIGVIVVVRFIRKRIDLRDRQFALLGGMSLVSIFIWCLVMFSGGSTVVHQGTQVWIFALLVAPVVWLWNRSKPVAVGLIVAQAIVFLIYYVPMWHGGSLRLSALGIGVLGAATMVLSLTLKDRFSREFHFARQRSSAAATPVHVSE